MEKILVLTDNMFIYESFLEIIKKKGIENMFHFFTSVKNETHPELKTINIKELCKNIIENYSLVISAHCKQFFPAELVNNVRCINIHPGLNPHNRGWFPQVFSIINKKPIGVTIHEMDEELDHGPIIYQEEVKIYPWDTSIDVYNRVQDVEVDLLDKYIENIINNDYSAKISNGEGNINLKKDFNFLCHLNLDEKLTMREAIDKLRALTHGEYKNAFFVEKDEKIFVSINLEREKRDE